MKTYILGSGGIGGYFGGKLAKSGADVTFVARGEHYKAIKKDGLQLNTTDGNFTIKPAKIIEKIVDIKDADLIILATKTYDTISVCEELAKNIDKNTIILTLQNGINNDEIVREILPNNLVIPGLAYVITAKTAPGVISQTGGMKKIVFGDRDNAYTKQIKQIEKLLKAAEIDANVSKDITSDLWQKFIFISAFSGMTALCRSNIGKIRENKLTRDLYIQCIQETIDVAVSLNVNLPDAILENIMNITDNTAAQAKSSLLIDIENDKPSEIVSLNGTVSRLGLEQGVATPINLLIFSVLQL